MKNSPKEPKKDFKKMLSQKKSKEERLKLANDLVDELQVKCPQCSEPLSLLRDETVRCTNWSCSIFLVELAGSQMTFDF